MQGVRRKTKKMRITFRLKNSSNKITSKNFNFKIGN